MTESKGKPQSGKERMHPRNKHRSSYDLQLLQENSPELKAFVRPNKYGTESIDFADPKAVKALNKALLKTYYNINHWDIPEGYLCPPVPGRADYIHHLADLLGSKNYNLITKGKRIKCLDIGVGSSCIYPIVGVQEYGWSFIAVDTDPKALDSSKAIVKLNEELRGKVDLRFQADESKLFEGVIEKDELFDLSMCNPPFHASAEEALASSRRKVRNLKHENVKNPVRNFGGQNNELWCKGGEKRFVNDMIFQSQKYAKNCFWFSTLISKHSNLKFVYNALERAKAVQVETINMGQGNKSSRLVAWTFLSKEEQKEWRNQRFKVKRKYVPKTEENSNDE